MDINFVKMQSCGKDYILLDGFKHALPDENGCRTLSRHLTNRHFGVGGYGFLLLKRGEDAQVAAQMFSSRGLEVEPSSDALRCLGRYAFDAGLLGKTHNRIQTKSQTYSLNMIDNKNITVNIGPPFYCEKPGEIRENLDVNIDRFIQIDKKQYTYTPIKLAGYNAVLFVTDYNLKLSKFAGKLQNHFKTSPPSQVVFVWVYGREEFRVRIWEPKRRETLSSGAGDCAAVVASVLHGFSDRDAVVHNRGGDLYIRWDEKRNHLFITGSVEYSFTGTFYWETWEKGLSKEAGYPAVAPR